MDQNEILMVWTQSLPSPHCQPQSYRLSWVLWTMHGDVGQIRDFSTFSCGGFRVRKEEELKCYDVHHWMVTEGHLISN